MQQCEGHTLGHTLGCGVYTWLSRPTVLADDGIDENILGTCGPGMMLTAHLDGRNCIDVGVEVVAMKLKFQWTCLGCGSLMEVKP